MKRNPNPLRIILAASAVLLTGAVAGPVQAAPSAMDYDAAVPCNAFQRSAHGGWTAVAPVTLNIDNGMALSFRPGDSMAPGSTIAGVAVPIILDRHCGNM
jgi:hypothetical protein